MEYWTNIILSPTVIIGALLIGTFGEVTKRLVKAEPGDRGWKGVYYVTLPAHPVVVGCLIGLIPWLPAAGPLEKAGYEFASRLGTYALAGVVAKIGYDTMVSTAKRFIQQRSGVDDDGGSSELGPDPTEDTESDES